MPPIVEPAPAKLNFALHVRRRRADGYHDLETLFAFARHGDTVTLAPADVSSFRITGPFAAALTQPLVPSEVEEHAANIDNDNNNPPFASSEVEKQAPNLVTRAEAAFRAAFAIAAPHAITLDKHLPVASGIGGGSADAAATLRALARLHGIAPDDARLAAVAASLGADVPACLAGRTALGTGRGDALRPLPPLGDVPALLVNPGVAVSTAAVFAAWDGVDRGALDPARWRAGRNDLQPAATRLAPAIAQVLAWLAARPGASLARMSGSGATCFALFADPAARDAAAGALAAEHPGWWRLATALA